MSSLILVAGKRNKNGTEISAEEIRNKENTRLDWTFIRTSLNSSLHHILYIITFVLFQ